MDDVVVTSGLVKAFGRARALDGLDLRVAEGEVHGFLGPNGAGKSTTIRVLLGLIRATGGDARVFGRDPWRDAVAVHADLASVPGDVALWPNLTGGETIDLLTGLRGGADPQLRERLVRDFDLDTRKHARSYSKGNRQKVALVAAFARPARLYVLDEPTSGLDPVMEEVFRAEVRRVRSEGATVLLSSHILSEVEALCDRVTIVRAGRVVEEGSLADMRHLTRSAVTVTTDAPADRIEALPGVHDLVAEDGTLRFGADASAVAGAIAALDGHRVETLTVEPPSLEELFLRHYGQEAR
ncbi:ABC-2 type transport system ATP-binding protein [Curtobacterium pusillum]|uniref:ABC-2 type transport system ATP-binding protein n=1 Tax=Curtobacterium pusillum TaxID=69373 RepID=A0AAW3T2G2_9MICO|nr:ABC transporter ATP-binding protein [Curtobacterium pusillum]MBA8989165.1 ABC-2 type transport system ATP-binding protein [Curtobacterium pusillum]